MAANINIRVDEDVKKKAEQLFEELGMNMTTAINVFLKKSIAFGGIPFEVARNTSELDRRLEDIKAGKNVSAAFSSVSELMEDLNADD